jgi:hypothetical protein
MLLNIISINWYHLEYKKYRKKYIEAKFIIGIEIKIRNIEIEQERNEWSIKKNVRDNGYKIIHIKKINIMS